MNIESNHEINSLLIMNIASAVIQQQSIDPDAKNLIQLFGIGGEKNNREAILFWVNSSLHQMTNQQGALISVLNDNFEDELNSFNLSIN